MLQTSGQRHRKHITTACLPCREAKAKCSGDEPCERCSKKNVQCAYDDVADGRSQRLATKRKFEVLEQEVSLLKGIVESLRNSDEDGTLGILTIIKNGASYAEIHQCIQPQLEENDHINREHTTALSNLDVQVASVIQAKDILEGPSELSHSHQHKKTPKISRLVDDPPLKVPAEPWTTVVQDNHLVSHLVSLWAGWNQWLGGLVVVEYFIHDMQAAKNERDSEFCSPFLVNCILAAGCYFSDYHEARTRDLTASRLQKEFMAEASRMWEQTRNQEPTLTAVQGLGTYYALVAMENNDEMCYELLLRLTEMVEELERQHHSKVPGSPDEEKFLHALGVACWGTFANTTATCRSLMKPQHMTVPRLDIPSEHSKATEKWAPYPSELIPVDSYTSESRYQISKLMTLDAQLTNIMFYDSSSAQSMSPHDQAKSLIPFHEKLKLWQSKLPPYLQPRKDATPDILLFNAWYYGILLDIASTLRKLEPNTSDPVISQVIASDIDSAVAVANIYRTYQSSWDMDRVHPCFIQPIGCALFRLASELPIERSEAMYEYDEVITDLCIFARAIVRRVPFASSLLQIFQRHVHQGRRSLPPLSENLFIDFEANELTTLTRRY